MIRAATGRALLALLLLGLTAAPPALAQAPTAKPEYDGYRRFLFAAVGAVIGTVPAMITKEETTGGEGLCTSRSCLTALSGGMGAAVGFLIGREKDQAAALRAAAGPSLSFSTRAVQLELDPERVQAFSGGALVLGQAGIAVVDREGGPVRVRGEQIRGIQSAAAVPEHDAVLAGTLTGLFSFPLRGERGEGQLVLREAAAALEPIGSDQVVMGGENLLRRLRVTGSAAALRLTEEARIDSPGAFNAIAYAPFAGVVWTLSGDRLVARSTTSLEEVGSVTLPVQARSLSLAGSRAVIAAGTDGLLLADVQRPEAPRLITRIEGPRFAYDAVVIDDAVYVAAGRQGVIVIDISDPSQPRTIGALRNIGYVRDVALGEGGTVYAADRDGQRLFLVHPREPGGSRE